MDIVWRRQFESPPKVSFILLDWSCRDSFHILDYFARQDVPRDAYEVIWIEYWDRQAPQLAQALQAARDSNSPPPFDAWYVLDMPAKAYYHKHLMYNVGIALARGQIVTVMDSDAFFKPTFVRSIIEAFDKTPRLVLHHDEVRNNSRRFYPFNNPDFTDGIGEGAINWWGSATRGILDPSDPIHLRNYGACMSARRDDLLMIGGADEHLDYLGHICGPYEMTFRLMNAHRTERWHESEFLYHVWHPGQAGDNNFGGPHDGRHMSTPALEVLGNGRVRPMLENPAIRLLREGTLNDADVAGLSAALLEAQRIGQWRIEDRLTREQTYAIGGRNVKLREVASPHGDTRRSGLNLRAHKPLRMALSRAGTPHTAPASSPATAGTTAPTPAASHTLLAAAPRTSPALRRSTKLLLLPLILKQAMHRGTDRRSFARRMAREKFWVRRCWHRLCMAYLQGADDVMLIAGPAYARAVRIFARDLALRVSSVISPSQAVEPAALPAGWGDSLPTSKRAARPVELSPDQARQVVAFRGTILLLDVDQGRAWQEQLAKLGVEAHRLRRLK